MPNKQYVGDKKITLILRQPACPIQFIHHSPQVPVLRRYGGQGRAWPERGGEALPREAHELGEEEHKTHVDRERSGIAAVQP